MIKSLIPVLAGLALLGACATATPYQAASNSARGYSDQQIEQNRWMVNFNGNSMTDRRTVETYLLYRAAELTTQNGYDHFRMVNRATDTDTSLIPVGGDPYYGYFSPHYRFYGPRGRLISRSYWGPRGYYDPFWAAPQEYRQVTRFEASAEILMDRGEKPDDPAWYSADEVLTNLAGTIMRPST